MEGEKVERAAENRARCEGGEKSKLEGNCSTKITKGERQLKCKTKIRERGICCRQKERESDR